jgi:omega-6 fatty acid desaturase (delta-12 desaturase)
VTHTNAAGPGNSARDWLPILNKYRTPSWARGLFEIIVTLVPFVALWIATWACLQLSYWLSLAIAVPAAGFLVRLFMIQHDCGHGSFFRRRLANDWTGRAISILTLTPYDYWKRSHAIHHASSGNLDERGIGDIRTLTVAEYLASSRWQQIGYRLYRNPFVMFGIGPAYLFLIQHRIPNGRQLRNWRAWLSPMATNLAVGLVALGVVWMVGLQPFLLVQLPIILLAASIGVWLFYIQHQFEETHWSRPDDWSVHDAALHGSSHYDLPPVMQWMTANIGVHHVHHLCSRIPYYRLGAVIRENPDLQQMGRITFLESLACVRLTLWDEGQKRLISFRQFRHQYKPVPI